MHTNIDLFHFLEIENNSDNNNNDTSDYLPAENVDQIASYLDVQSLGRLSQTGKRPQTFLKVPLFQKKAEKLLKLVMDGNPIGVQKLLSVPHSGEEISMVLRRAEGKEECGRHWGRISPLEYAAWAGDSEILQLLLQAVPESQRQKAAQLLQHVMQHGTEHGLHMSAYAYLLEAYDENRDKFQIWNWSQRRMFALEIGRRQFMLPIVGLQQICDTELFDPLPSFEKPPERSLLLSEGGSLLPLSTSRLGQGFVLIKVAHRAVCPGFGRAVSWIVPDNQDSAAIRRLCEVRKKELVAIVEQLQEPSEQKTKNSKNECVIS